MKKGQGFRVEASGRGWVEDAKGLRVPEPKLYDFRV